MTRQSPHDPSAADAVGDEHRQRFRLHRMRVHVPKRRHQMAAAPVDDASTGRSTYGFLGANLLDVTVAQDHGASGDDGPGIDVHDVDVLQDQIFRADGSRNRGE
jgi:hypothetical protein